MVKEQMVKVVDEADRRVKWGCFKGDKKEAGFKEPEELTEK